MLKILSFDSVDPLGVGNFSFQFIFSLGGIGGPVGTWVFV